MDQNPRPSITSLDNIYNEEIKAAADSNERRPSEASDIDKQEQTSGTALAAHERLVDEALERSSQSAAAAVPVIPVVKRKEPLDPLTAYFRTMRGDRIRRRLLELVRAFRARSDQSVLDLDLRPPTPEPHEVQPLPDPAANPLVVQYEIENILEGSGQVHLDAVTSPDTVSTPRKRSHSRQAVRIRIGRLAIRVPDWYFNLPRPESFDPHATKYLGWLTVVSVFFIYNAVFIPYRAAFFEPSERLWFIWLLADYIGDLINITDLIIWKPCIRVFVNGIEITQTKEIVRKYVRTQSFVFDVLSILPLDFIYLVPQVGINPLFRMLRILKIFSYWELLDRLDQLVSNPYYFRMARFLAYSMYLIHVNACIYYYYSYLYGFTSEDEFVYNNRHPDCQNLSKTFHNPVEESDKLKCNLPGDYTDYVFCFFFSVSMVTIIGNLSFPHTLPAMIYSFILWFVGVFVFATLVGQVRDVFKAMTHQEDEFYELMDAIVEHMHTLKIPKELQERVRTWLLYNWEQQRTIDEGKFLEGLPVRIRSDLAMEVHFHVISKVQLFKDVDKTVLEELLLRLKPNVFLPNDFICRRGEIGKEMYIVKSGVLEVVLPDGRVAVTLTPGSVFGEVSLLSLAGGNRRTADVRSKGFSNLYVLSKSDLNDVMKDYPETLDALRAKAQELLNKGKPPPEKLPHPEAVQIVPNRVPTPEMVHVATKVMNPGSAVRLKIVSSSASEMKALPDDDLHSPRSFDATVNTAAVPDQIPDNTSNHTDTKLQIPNGDIAPDRKPVVFPAVPPRTDTLNTVTRKSGRRRRNQAFPPDDSSSELEETPRGPRIRKKGHYVGHIHEILESRSSSYTSSNRSNNIPLRTLGGSLLPVVSGENDGGGSQEGESAASQMVNIKRRSLRSDRDSPDTATSSSPGTYQSPMSSTEPVHSSVSENL
ncbi:LOW QUALITY PROTEIN: cyclic nucleotide-gated cation channel beta-3-like [Paramacrobiotus metropolitanus]|uniref:LOW QUALITY PROTEIN: cyclic nucleotide-gated cation channel beta-3-like n=1 Tax=Paramacrobiotus metropolitanus TaxID=2943436 RepID=UPI0024463519|nr:LOW QUALITY PROTEIN: cyclic nucleotide-gated cation channel beta-3-like [Paramacrobiotus metropolitanus]